jgi:hypothetical protein
MNARSCPEHLMGRSLRRIAINHGMHDSIRAASAQPLRILLMAKLLIAGALVIVGATMATAPADCPTVSVACPEENATIQFTATVSSNNPDVKLTYQWSVSREVIISGQGTPKITVDAERNGKGIGATVEVLGLPTNCAKKASCYRTHF